MYDSEILRIPDAYARKWQQPLYISKNRKKPITIPKRSPVKKIYVEAVAKIILEEEKE